MGNPMTELQGVACHMGSHNVTCYPTQANSPRLNPSQWRLVLDLPTITLYYMVVLSVATTIVFVCAKIHICLRLNVGGTELLSVRCWRASLPDPSPVVFLSDPFCTWICLLCTLHCLSTTAGHECSTCWIHGSIFPPMCDWAWGQ